MFTLLYFIFLNWKPKDGWKFPEIFKVLLIILIAIMGIICLGFDIIILILLL